MKFCLNTCGSEWRTIVAVVTLNEKDLASIRELREEVLKAEKHYSVFEHNYWDSYAEYYNYDDLDDVTCAAILNNEGNKELLEAPVVRLRDDFKIEAAPIGTSCCLLHVQNDCILFSTVLEEEDNIETSELYYSMLFENECGTTKLITETGA